jgi:type II secretory pathway pseudopilin PulG
VSNRAGTSQAGISLIEILVAVSLLGSVVLALVGGLGSLVSSSDRHRRLATADTFARSYAEALKLTVRQRTGSWCSSSPYDVSANYVLPSGSGYAVSQEPKACPPAGQPQIQQVVVHVADQLPTHRGVAQVTVTVRPR